jgi:hypothetical protein
MKPTIPDSEGWWWVATRRKSGRWTLDCLFFGESTVKWMERNRKEDKNVMYSRAYPPALPEVTDE